MPITTITSKITKIANAVKNDLTRSASEQRLESKMTLLPATPFNASVERSARKDCFVTVPQKLHPKIDKALVEKQNLEMCHCEERGTSDAAIQAKKAEEQAQKVVHPQTPVINNQDDLRKHLKALKDKNGKAIIDTYEIDSIVNSAKTPEQAQIKFDLTVKFAQLKDKNGNMWINSFNIANIVSLADTPEKAQFKFDLAGKLAQLEDKNGNARLNSSDLTHIVLTTHAPEKAKFKIELAHNKEFLSKIEALDTAIGKRLYAESLIAGKKADVDRMNKLYNYLCENKINLQQHGEERITNESIVKLFNSSMFEAVDFLDEGVIKYATKLKYKSFEDFIHSSSILIDKLDKDTYSKLQSNLSKLSTPDLKFERMQSIVALRSVDVKNVIINEAIDLIKSTKTTVAQINLANEIFISNKPYQAQIQEFFEKFAVPKNRQDALRKTLLEQKINERLAPSTSTETQISIIEKKINDIKNNPKIPADKKEAAIKQQLAIKEKIKTEPQNTKLSDNALKFLAQQIEQNVNIPKNNVEFNSFLNSQIYKRLNIKPKSELLQTLNFDNQYLHDLFSGLSKRNFSRQFAKFIQLLNINPTKPLSELREMLKHNQQTKKLFKRKGINYQKWIKFDRNSSLLFSFETNLQEATKGVELNIVNELNGDLFKSVDKEETGKILKAIEDAGYKLNSNGITKNGNAVNQKDLEKIVAIFKNTINKNADFWDKPLADANAESLKNELIDHLLKGRKKEVADLATMANAKMDLVVRLSDDDDIGRNLFLGNHVGCCTAVGSINAFAAPQHLMNTFVRAIEIVDKNGNSYGNSMCYFAKIDGKLSFVIDSFDANGKLGRNQVVTDSIIQYAKQVTKEMGKPNIPIVFGPRYNKIDMSKLQKTSGHTIEIIGRVGDGTYIDAIGGNADVNTSHSNRNLYELRSVKPPIFGPKLKLIFAKFLAGLS